MNLEQYLNEIYQRTKKIWGYLFITSGIMLSFLLTLNFSVFIEYDGYTGSDYTVKISYALIASILMIPVYIFLYVKKDFINKTLQDTSIALKSVTLLASFMLFYQLLQDTQKNYDHILLALEQLLKINITNNYIYQIVIPILCLGSFVAIYLFLLYAFRLLLDYFKELCADSDKYEKIYFCTASMLCLSLICIFYSRTYGQWYSLDLVYQTDTSFIYEHYYPVFSFGYDFDWDIGNGGIRHPMATLFTYPVYILISFISIFLFWIPHITPILCAVMQSLFLIVTVILLKRLVKSNWAYFIFSLSYPFLFYTIFVEKYHLCVLFLVMYAYAIVNNKKKEQQGCLLIAASSMMITSAFCGFLYGKEKTLGKRLLQWIQLGGSFIILLIGSGRIHYIIDFFYLTGHNYNSFYSGTSSYTIYNKLCGFSHMLASCFIPVPYGEVEGHFYWTTLTKQVNVIGIVVFAIMTIGVVKNRKEKTVPVFLIWLLWAFIFYFIAGAGIGADPLFNWYFAWTIVPLFIMGINSLCKDILLKFVVYCGILSVMLYTNYVHLVHLYNFLLLKTPV